MPEKHKASPEMMKFFEKLLDLKKFIKNELDNCEDPIMREIYKKIDEIIKEKK